MEEAHGRATMLCMRLCPEQLESWPLGGGALGVRWGVGQESRGVGGCL